MKESLEKCESCYYNTHKLPSQHCGAKGIKSSDWKCEKGIGVVECKRYKQDGVK